MPFFRGLVRSFSAAVRGLLLAFQAERTFREMVACALVVVALVATLPLVVWERVILLCLTGLVLVLELVNSFMERLMDLLKPRLSTYVRDVKDLMAAAVLVASLVAAIAAALLLAPHAALLLHQV